MDDAYRFAPAAPEEEYVYGAAAPGWHSAVDHETAVAAWIGFMRDQGIERVCCLLPGEDVEGCQYNLRRYEEAFGARNVLHAPIPDRRLGDQTLFEGRIFPFLDAASTRQTPTVVHGLSGLGRTGQVLAAWLVYGRGYDPDAAIDTVRSMGRSPEEPIVAGPASEADTVGYTHVSSIGPTWSRISSGRYSRQYELLAQFASYR